VRPQQGDALDVVRHREDAEATERERDPLPATAFSGGNQAPELGICPAETCGGQYASAILRDSKCAQSAHSKEPAWKPAINRSERAQSPVVASLPWLHRAAPRAGRGAGHVRSAGPVFEEMVRDEEKHADWFESQLDAIERVGLSQYLAQQIKPGEAPPLRSVQ
jgi:hypothetical protein